MSLYCFFFLIWSSHFKRAEIIKSREFQSWVSLRITMHLRLLTQIWLCGTFKELWHAPFIPCLLTGCLNRFLFHDYTSESSALICFHFINSRYLERSRLDNITMNFQYCKYQWLGLCSLWAKCSHQLCLDGLKTKTGFYILKWQQYNQKNNVLWHVRI